MKVHLSVSTLAKPKLHCAQRAQSNLTRLLWQAYREHTTCGGMFHIEKHTATGGYASYRKSRQGFISTRRRRLPSRARGAYRAHTVCISRGIPPVVDMLHITCGFAAHITASKARHTTPFGSSRQGSAYPLFIIRKFSFYQLIDACQLGEDLVEGQVKLTIAVKLG